MITQCRENILLMNLLLRPCKNLGVTKYLYGARHNYRTDKLLTRASFLHRFFGKLDNFIVIVCLRLYCFNQDVATWPILIKNRQLVVIHSSPLSLSSIRCWVLYRQFYNRTVNTIHILLPDINQKTRFSSISAPEKTP